MLKRKINTFIRDWINKYQERENNHISKCLLIRGLRQVGKSYSIRTEIGLDPDNVENIISNIQINGRNFTSIELNLTKNDAFKTFFENDKSTESILNNIALNKYFRNVDLTITQNHGVLLFIDEIQTSASAIAALKYLSKTSGLIVIASGSLLGLELNSSELFPVGSLDEKEMFPLDFEEFLWANNYSENFVSRIITNLTNIEKIFADIHQELEYKFREYAVCGGLPQNVLIATIYGSQSEQLYQNQKSLLNGYISDIAKYAPKDVKNHAQAIFESIPRVLARENTKYTYNSIKNGAKSKDYKNGLSWLISQGMIYKVNNVSILNSPLIANVIENSFKLYLADSSMLVAMYGKGSIEAVLNMNEDFQKGMFFENIVAELLYTMHDNVFYFSRNSTLEIDFLVENNATSVFIEAKSSNNTKAKSLSTIMKENPSSFGLKISAKNIGKNGKLFSLPHYALNFYKEIIK